MKIWLDADACPRDVKEIVYRASERLGIAVVLVANQEMRLPPSSLVSLVRVPKEMDAADHHIIHHLAAGDLVVTADVPLAAEAVGRGAAVIDPRGEEYSEENTGERLSLRNFMQDLRSAGLIQGGPPPLTPVDRHRFAAALDRALTRLMKEANG